MEKVRDNLGFIEIDKLDITIENLNKNIKVFFYNGKKYYFKKCKKIDEVYNELIAEEIAKDYGINHVHYDLASYNGFIGVISEDFIKDNNYTSINDILTKFYKTDIEKHNNLEDIWCVLDYLYKNKCIVSKLMNELVNIFIYDIITGNIDRHVENYGIIEGGKICFNPIFDNEKILSDDSIIHGIYSIGIDESDYHKYAFEYGNNDNFIDKFLNLSDELYAILLKEKISIINDENIDIILNKVENRIKSKIPQSIINKIRLKFKQNKEMINDCLNKYINKKKILKKH